MKEWLEWYENNPQTSRKGERFIDKKDTDGLTALHYAARFNKFEIISQLLLAEAGQ